MSNIVIIGAGQTGRGYLNRFFGTERVTFVDKEKTLIDALQANPSYQVFFGAKERAPVTLENYDAYLIDSQEGLRSLAEADLIMISVGQQNLKTVSDILQKALAMRTKQDVDILTAENGVNVTKELKFLCEDKRVHLAEAIVFCTTVKTEHSLDILSENRDYLPYDVVALGHELPYENMAAEENLDVLMQRKIYTYNCVSAVVSYLGYYKNYQVYSDAANDIEIEQCIHKILKTLNTCICLEYGISQEEQEEFAEMAVKKFQNKNIVDTIERNARNVDRKLGPTERILAPLSIIHRHQKECPELLLVAACAIYYGKKTNTLKKDIDMYFETLPPSWTRQIKEKLKTLEQ
ncbi:MAG: hypothetical protein Q4C52_12100 [Eubacteriales bacterium]|nr:hypothetical protein [Eubacteriales bacterium]